MIEKFKDGETLAEYRINRRNKRRAGEVSVKTAIRVRDGIGCRWPGCVFWKRGYRVDGAHIDSKGIGGDPKLIRTTTANLIRLCVRHHGPGPDSVHSGDRRVIMLTDRGADGPCQFEVADPKAEGGWRVEGVEDDFTFTRRRNESAMEDIDGGDEF